LRKNPPPALHDDEIHAGLNGRPADSRRRSRKASGATSRHTPCCVCWRTGGTAENELLFCGRCHMAVHRQCYGVERKRKDGGGLAPRRGQASQASRAPWFCTRCEIDVADAQQGGTGAASRAASGTNSSTGAAAVPPPAQVAPGWGVGTGECWYAAATLLARQ
jgi:hypothetical protein